MKVRTLSLIVALVLLSTFLLAVPVQAGRTVTPFTFHITDVEWELPKYVMNGPVGHYVLVFRGTVVSDEPRLDGGRLTWTLHGSEVFPNPQPVIIGTAWGAFPGKWQIITSAEREPLSGWEGSATCGPWTDPDKWPDSGVLHARGNGFGLYKNMHIEWSGFWVPFYEQEGDISENSE